MVFEWQDEGRFHRIPKLEPGPGNVYFGKNPSLLVPILRLSDYVNPLLTGFLFWRRRLYHRIEG